MGQGSSSEKNTQQLNAESRSHEKNINKNKNELIRLRQSIDNLHMEIQNNKRDREQDDKISQIKKNADEDRMKREAEESIQNDSLKRLQTESSSLRNNITGVNTELSQLGQRVSGYNIAVTGLESRLAENSKKLLSVESGLAANSRRLGNVESVSAVNSTRLGNVQSGLAANSRRLGNVESVSAVNSTRLGKVQSGLTNIFKRLGNVESVSAVNSRRLGNVESGLAANSRKLGTLESSLATISKRSDGGYTSTSNFFSYYLNIYKNFKMEVYLKKKRLKKEKNDFERYTDTSAPDFYLSKKIIADKLDSIKKLDNDVSELQQKEEYNMMALYIETIKSAYPNNFVDDLKQYTINNINIKVERYEESIKSIKDTDNNIKIKSIKDTDNNIKIKSIKDTDNNIKITSIKETDNNKIKSIKDIDYLKESIKRIKSIKDTDYYKIGELFEVLFESTEENKIQENKTQELANKIDMIKSKHFDDDLEDKDFTDLLEYKNEYITLSLNMVWAAILKKLINKKYNNNVPKEVKDKFQNYKLELIKNTKIFMSLGLELDLMKIDCRKMLDGYTKLYDDYK